MVLPDRLDLLKGLPNLPTRPGQAAKFFICEESHVEGWRGEIDLDGTPCRPCSVCGRNMVLASLRYKKDGSLSKYQGRKSKTGQVKPIKKSSKRLLDKYVREVSRSDRRYEAVDTEHSFKKLILKRGDRPWQKGRLMFRRCAVVEEVNEWKVKVTFKGIVGWLDDFKQAAKRLRVLVKFEFEQPDNYKVIPYKASKKGTKR